MRPAGPAAGADRLVEKPSPTPGQSPESPPWTRRHRRASDLSPFDAVLAAFETLAHLELLAGQGQLQPHRG